jgi:hypothetical protein
MDLTAELVFVFRQLLAESGDQTGASLRPRSLANGVAPPRARSTSQRLDSDGEGTRTNIALVPSGEIRASA